MSLCAAGRQILALGFAGAVQQTLEVITGESVNGMPNVYVGATIEDVENFLFRSLQVNLCELVKLKPPSPP